MSDSEYRRKQEELDRLLNDPATPMQSGRVWDLLEELARAMAAEPALAAV